MPTPRSSPHSFLSPRRAAAERVLTFLQSARDRDVPVRFGKWSCAEDAYLAKLVTLFRDGLLADVGEKTSLRSWLAHMLSCCPMRISKKQMHGHGFEGKHKFRRSAARVARLTQTQYDALNADVLRLRDDFLRTWAQDEMERRAKSVGGSFEDWYTRVKQHAPTPKIHRHAKLVPYEEKQKKKKTQIRPLLVEQETPQVQVCEPVEILPLEPAPIMPPTALVPANAGPILNDAVNMGDWMVGPSARGYTAQWNDFQTGGHVGEARYTFCEDQVQVSVHLGEEQNSLAGMSMTRRTSRLVIDFGAPSCWHAGEEPKRTSFSDSPCWSDSDMTDEIALLMDPGVFSWDDASSMNHVTYTTPLNLL